jgi:hypothetical protein
MQLSKEQILAAEDLDTVIEPVPEWGGDVTLKMLSAKERINWEQEVFPNGVVDTEKFLTSLVARSLVDGSGARMFSDDELDALGAKNPAVIARLREAAAKLNKIGQTDQKEAEKNSAADSVSSDSSSSPSDSATLTPT